MARNRWITNIYIFFFIPSYFFSLSFFFFFPIIPREFARQQIFFVDRQRLNFPVWFWWFLNLVLAMTRQSCSLPVLSFIVDLTFSLEIVSCYSCFVEHFIDLYSINDVAFDRFKRGVYRDTWSVTSLIGYISVLFCENRIHVSLWRRLKNIIRCVIRCYLIVEKNVIIKTVCVWLVKVDLKVRTYAHHRRFHFLDRTDRKHDRSR